MKLNSGIPDTEEYYGNDKRRTARMLAAIAIILALGPSSCDDMSLPMWSSTNHEAINIWYDRMESLGATIFLFGPLLLFLADRLHRWLSRGVIRWSLFVLHLSELWYPVNITGWNSQDMRVIEHPIFNSCLYLSVLLSGILWVTFRGDRRWLFRVLYEFLPFALLIAAHLYLSSLDPPDFNWG